MAAFRCSGCEQWDSWTVVYICLDTSYFFGWDGQIWSDHHTIVKNVVHMSAKSCCWGSLKEYKIILRRAGRHQWLQKSLSIFLYFIFYNCQNNLFLLCKVPMDTFRTTTLITKSKTQNPTWGFTWFQINISI